MSLSDILPILGIIGGYYVLMRWVLPKLGIPT